MDFLSPHEKKIIRDFKEKLQSLYESRITEIKLFGSRARGESHEESDLDLLVVLKDLTRNEKTEILDLACDLWLDSGIMLSPLVMSQSHFQMLRDRERLLVKDIERDGISL